MKREKIQNFRRALKDDFAAGIFMKTSDAAFVECAGYAGMDFCILDMEHGPASYERMQNLIRACECASAIPIIRVAAATEEYIGKALDLGAAGIQIPKVTVRADAEQAVKCAKFYPDGERGVCRYVRAAAYSSQDKFAYFREANDTLVVIQVEGREGVRNLEDILTVPGIDVVFIGPYDLSQSLGVTGDVHHPKVEAQMKQAVKAADQAGIAVGTFVDTTEDGLMWKKLGVRYIAQSVDVGIFYQACKRISDGLKSEEH